MNDTIVVTDQLTKRYGGRTAVDRVDLTVRHGEVYGFLGPNGAGKTTTLRMLLGLARPSSGTARILGGRPGSPAVLRRVGALVEGPGFYPYLSGRDNLRVLARYRGVGGTEVEDALDTVDLRHRAADRFKAYSMGRKQRLGGAGALLGRPDLLILDEPTNGLDPAGMADMRRLLRRLAEGGQTVLLSSHLLGDVQQICDRVGVIASGRLVAESTVDDLRETSGVRLRAEPVDLAVRTLARVTSAAVHREPEGLLRIELPADRCAALARALVHAGVDVHEIGPIDQSLEDAFFEMTGTVEVAS